MYEQDLRNPLGHVLQHTYVLTGVNPQQSKFVVKESIMKTRFLEHLADTLSDDDTDSLRGKKT